MSKQTPARRGVVALVALTAALAFSTTASAVRELFFEETASAFWAVPHQCADGSIVQATLLVQPTRDFESPDTEDPDPTARLQFLAVCPDGTSFSWGLPLSRRRSRAPRTSRASVPQDRGPPGTTSAERIRSPSTRPGRVSGRSRRRSTRRGASDRTHSDRDGPGDLRRRRSRRRRGQPPDPAGAVHPGRHREVGIRLGPGALPPRRGPF
jgi:hypothetical protein